MPAGASLFGRPDFVGEDDRYRDDIRGAALEIRIPRPTMARPIIGGGGPPFPVSGLALCARRMINARADRRERAGSRARRAIIY